MRGKKQSEQTAIRITSDAKTLLQTVGKRRNLTLTQMLVDGGLFMASFPDVFVEQIEKIAIATRLTESQVMVQLFLVYIATDSATLEVYGKSPTFSRAFQFDHGELVTGDRLSDKVFNEVLKSAKDLKQRLQNSASGKTKTAFISNQDAAQISTQLTQDQPSI